MTDQPILDNAHHIWDAVLGELQLQIPRPSYETWLDGTTGVAISDNEFVVRTPNAFVAEMLDQRMYSLISQNLERVIGDEIEVRFEVGDHKADGSTASRATDAAGTMRLQMDEGNFANSQVSSRPSYRRIGLNSKYRLENYIIGSSNNLAHAAALAVSENPGAVYNPFVIYSGAGLGKTHLMHAIGHRLRESGRDVMYSTTEDFTNEYIKAIRGGTTEEFRDRYRSADVLLLDEPLSGTDPRQRLHFMDVMKRIAAEGRTIVISSHILEEVESLADRIILLTAGKVAATGEYRAIREKLNERPYLVLIECDTPRLLGAGLLEIEAIESVEVDEDGRLRVRSRDVAALQRALPRIARDRNVRLLRIQPLDDSLESVFEYLAQQQWTARG